MEPRSTFRYYEETYLAPNISRKSRHQDHPLKVPSALSSKSPTQLSPRASDRRCDPRFLPPQPQAKDRQGNQPAYLKEVHVEYLPSPPLLRKVRLLVLNLTLHHSHPPSPSPVPSFHHLQPHHRATTLLVAAAFLVDHMR